MSPILEMKNPVARADKGFRSHLGRYTQHSRWMNKDGSAIDFRAINAAALPVLPAILKRILPGGKCNGREYLVRNPRRNDRNIGSFSINLRTGRWADFAIGQTGGDVIALIAYLEGLSQCEAARRLARMVRIDCRRRSRG